MNDAGHAQTLDDNARKFVVSALEPGFLEAHGASSFTLVTDWLDTGEDDETKLAYKTFASGGVQILLIAKVTKDGRRSAQKQEITRERYEELLNVSVLHVEKTRSECDYTQGDLTFSLKYDEFTDSTLRVLEVDAATDQDRAAFDPQAFPGTLREVTGDVQYYGYRVSGVL